MKWLLKAAAALLICATVISPVAAQTVPTDATVQTCSEVIDLQYKNDRSRDGQCVGAVETWLDAVGAPSAAADPQIADLVAKLAELYQDDPDCKIADTELPLAIATAAGRVFDKDVKAEYLLISEQIKSCKFEGTAAINSGSEDALNPNPQDSSPN